MLKRSRSRAADAQCHVVHLVEGETHRAAWMSRLSALFDQVRGRHGDVHIINLIG